MKRPSAASAPETSASVQLPGARSRLVVVLRHVVPDVAVDAWVAPSATLVGAVEVQDRASVWHGAVLRGDLNAVVLGAYSSLGDRCVVHAAAGAAPATGLSAEAVVGKYVTVAPACTLRSCTIDDEVVLGERCVLMEGSLVERHAVLRAGTVVPPGRRIPGGQLWAGCPARYVRDLTPDDVAEIGRLAEAVHKCADEYAAEFLPYGTAYLEVEKLRKALNMPVPSLASAQ
eukprot:SM000045S16206  [mRNA]  locus=s45:242120:243232:- [translate_table: standard]